MSELTVDRHGDEVANAFALGMTNGGLEAMSSTVRLMSHRSRGCRRLQSLLALITFVCGRTRSRYPRECTKKA